jgi:DNA-binding beta-propeller fold protein YncE
LLLSLVAGADARTAYVSNSSGQSITRIDTASNTPGTPIAFPGGTNPRGSAITPDGATAYVVGQFANNVTPVSTQTGIVGTPIPASAAAVTRRVSLQLRLRPGLYRITVRAYAGNGSLTRPARRWLRILG